jgi:hypothetical protein
MKICYSIKRVAEQDRVRTKTRAWGTVSRLMIDATKVRWKAATKGTERELRWSASTRVKVEGSLCKKPSTLPFVVGWWGGPSWFIYFLIFFKIWPSLFICCLSIVMCSPLEIICRGVSVTRVCKGVGWVSKGEILWLGGSHWKTYCRANGMEISFLVTFVSVFLFLAS